LIKQRRTRAVPQVSTAKSLPAPIGGLNARDALGEMPVTDAVVMTNWWPSTSNVILRYGYSEYATFVDEGETLLVYNGTSDNEMFVVSATGDIYDVSSGGAVGAAVVTGLTNARFQSQNVTTTGGSFLMSVNGADKLRYYDGTTWEVDGGGTYSITGVDTADCSNITLFKNRVWLTEDNTLDAWYLGTSAIQGAATKFPLGGIAQQGGSIIAAAAWTIDAGDGVNDMMVFITSNDGGSEVIVYQGTDPASANTWALIGIWTIGSVIGKRCFLKYRGDLLIICRDGVVPMSSLLVSSKTTPVVTLTDKIQRAVSQSVALYGANFGWQMVYFAQENQLYLNVPVQEGNNQTQYVMNTITRNWSNFSGWDANCWAIYNGEPYFASNGYVGKAWDTLADNDTNIDGFCIQAFSDFGDSRVQKRFTLMRPILFTNGSPSLLGEINVDFDLSDTTAALSFTANSYGTWDNGLWDSAVWGTDLTVQQNWQGVTGIGFYGAPVMKIATQGIETQWTATTIVFEPQKGTFL
jgi:hypothetical protein